MTSPPPASYDNYSRGRCWPFGTPVCFCGQLASNAPLRSIPRVGPHRNNLSDHGYARCGKHLRENACPGCPPVKQ